MKKHIGVLVFVLFLFAYQAQAQRSEHSRGGSQSFERDQASTGALELSNQEGIRIPSVLLNTHINGDVTGLIARVQVNQTFQNDSEYWVNGKYHFPLPEGAAIDSLVIEVGERIIRGVVKEKEEAKRTFEQAKKAGKKAGLLQQHRPNMFSISVANIAPYEKINASLTFIDTVQFNNKSFSLQLPTTFTPRYVPDGAQLSQAQLQAIKKELSEPQELTINTNNNWANAKPVEDSNELSSPFRKANKTSTTHSFSLSLTVDAGIDIERFIASHPINETFTGNTTRISLAQKTELMNADFRLTWLPIKGTAPQAALFSQRHQSETNEEQHFSFMMLMPPSIDTNMSLPRDVTFVIDSSGSMAGTSIEQAKQALVQGLDSLTGQDRFNVIDFDSRFTPLYRSSQTASLDRIQNAKNMIRKLKADGGTEMLGAMQYAMNTPSDPSYLKQIIFITDGAVGYEHQTFKTIADQLGDARLFTVGIGSAPNTYFMSKAAKFGRGTYTYISNLNEVSTKMGELFKTLTRPVMRDIKLDWGQEVEQFPQVIPDLYSGEPIMVVLKSQKEIQHVVATGAMLNTPWQQRLSNKANNQDSQSEGLDTVWARKKISLFMDQMAIGDLSKEQAKAAILPLSLEHQILSKFASFVAVEDTVSKPKGAATKAKHLANLMPKGNTMPIPQTASPATLFSLLGLVLMILGGLLRNRAAK